MGAIDAAIWAAYIAQALDLLRFEAGIRVKVLKLLVDMQRELVAELSQYDLTEFGKARANALLRDSAEIIKTYYKDIDTLMAGKLFGMADVVMSHTKQAVTSAMKVNIAYGLPPENYLKKLVSDVLIQGAPSAKWWERQSGDTAFRFANEVRQGLAQGQTTQQIVSRIVGRGGEPGIMDIARRNANALVTTSAQTVAAAARRETYQRNSDVIKGIRQVSTLDSHTTAICMAYDGAEFDLNDEPINGTTLPYNGGVPRHWGCRSIEVPTTKTFKELGIDMPEPDGGTRASTDGQVSDKMKFEDFLKTKSTQWQDEKLGKGKAELWRSGKMSLTQLLDQSGNPLTLKQLREIYH